MADSPKSLKHQDLIRRGVKEPSPAGTLTFLGLRALDPLLQYKLLSPTGWGVALLSKLGLSASFSSLQAFHSGIPLLDSLNLPLPHLIILGMAIGSAAKQAYWLTVLSQEEFPPGAAVAVSGYNTFVNSLNSLLLVWSATSSLSGSGPSVNVFGTNLPITIVIGSIMYIVGITVETAAEYQRKVFKARPENKGKPITTGLWSWARHINYGGYAVWRAGYCLASSGWVGGVAMGLFQSNDFRSRGVPVLDEYCSERYGEQWAQFKRDVKWVLIPGIY
jgi:protein-S-isoprenylcysteine O-methyltransferase Ste14